MRSKFWGVIFFLWKNNSKLVELSKVGNKKRLVKRKEEKNKKKKKSSEKEAKIQLKVKEK